MNIIKRKELIERSPFQKLFNVTTKENAIIELNNLFADHHLSMIRYEEVVEIAYRYQIVFEKEFKPQILDIYKKFLTHYLEDRRLSEDEIKNLKHIKLLLSLKDDDVRIVHQQANQDIYKKEVERAIEDKKLSEEEKSFLEKLQKELELSNEIATKIYKESASERVHKLLAELVSDERLSPQEEKELQEIAQNLNLTLELSDGTKELLERYKLYWQIENGQVPEVEVNVYLQKNEKCFFHTPCTWHEQRRVVKRYNYSGPTLRFKIVKGIYWRAGSIKPKTIAEDQWQLIDKGHLYLTNKRLIFMGNKGNKPIRLSTILDFSVYKNGVDIQRSTGKSPFLGFENNNELFAIIFGKVLGNQ